MESEIMLSDTFDDIYQEIDALIKQKKEMFTVRGK